MASLPDEVLEIIFLWVPAESLIRFECVSRSWYNLICALINDPAFVAKHLHNLNNNNNYYYYSSASLVFTRACHHVGFETKQHCNNARYSLLNSFTDDGVENGDRIGSVVEDLSLPLLHGGRYRWSDWFVSCHCDGIICLCSDHRRNIMLCNPVLREFKLLPESQNYDNWSCMGIGFGYDSRTDNYKFVRIFQEPRVKAEVYRLAVW
ncbi:F-box domain containing protein [Trema orientale]|uniref:F-box domain containing protein n=1 Tax=Trema orientale TaxID=63057 RepID=A0A2P5EE66_TREOI|nr:F-box domain containing protein [Trema orientale]